MYVWKSEKRREQSVRRDSSFNYHFLQSRAEQTQIRPDQPRRIRGQSLRSNKGVQN